MIKKDDSLKGQIISDCLFNATLLALMLAVRKKIYIKNVSISLSSSIKARSHLWVELFWFTKKIDPLLLNYSI